MLSCPLVGYPRLVSLVALHTVHLGPSLVMATWRVVTALAVGVDPVVALKMAARTGNLEMLAFVLVPVLRVSIPAQGGYIPGRPRIVTTGTVVIAPVGVT